MADTKELIIELQLKNDKLIKSVGETNSKLDKLNKKTNKSVGLIKKMKLGYVAVAGVLTGVVAKGLAFFTKRASDAQEITSKFSVVFKDVEKSANAMAKNLAENFGFSNVKAKELLGTTGDLLTGFGFTGAEALDLSDQVNRLAADLASFSNIEGGTERASEALTKAMLGETEQAKALGVVIRQQSPEFINLVKHYQEVEGATLLQAKALASLKIASDQSKNAIGDFARTQDEVANVARVVKGLFEDWAVSVGDKLLPAYNALLKVSKRFLTPTQDLDDVTNDLIKTQTTYKNVLAKLEDGYEDLTKIEKQNLQTKKALLELKMAKLIKETNDEYKKQTTILEKNEKLTAKYKSEIADLLEKLKGNKSEIIKLTTRQRDLLDVGQRLNTMTGIMEDKQITVKQATLLWNNANVKLTEQTSKTANINQKLSDGIDILTKAYINDKSAVLGLNDELKAMVIANVSALQEQEKAEKKLADARAKQKQKQGEDAADAKERAEQRKQNIKEFQALQKEELALLEEKKVQDEERDLTEQERHDIKKEQLTELMEFKKSMNQEELLSTQAKDNEEIISAKKKNVALRILRSQELAAAQTALGDLSTLMSVGNKKAFAIGKASALAQTTVSMIKSAQEAFSAMAGIPFVGPGLGVAAAAAAITAGGVRLNAISNTSMPKFASGGVIDQVAPANISGEDGIIGVRRGESVLNQQATVNLGRDTINQLNSGQGVNPNVNISVESNRPEDVVDVLNDYFRQYGTSEQGASI